MEVELTKENFETEVLKSDKKVLVDFWATWCGPCQMLAPHVEAVANELKDTLKVGKVNTDEQEELAIQYNIFSIPTLIIFENGKAVKQTAGYMTKEQLLDFVK